MKRKLLCIAFVCVFFLLSVTLSLGILAAGPSQAGANERLSQAPELFDKEGGFNKAYLSDAASWLNDHFFLRQELISLNNALTGNLLGTSGTEDVILGKDGWLYYGSTLDDFTGRNGMTQRQLYSAAHNLALMASYCRENGRQFAFMIAPNKNSLYPQFMPDYGVQAQVHDAHRLQQLLQQLQVPYIDLFAVLEQGKKDALSPLYFAHDSHWNELGAALAADAVNAHFGRESNYFGAHFAYPMGHSGDLYEMMYPAFSDPEVCWFYADQPLRYEFTGKANQPDSITLLTASDAPGSLLAYRDSFGNLLYPYLADSYGAARFSRATGYDLTLEGEDVLVELVERNLRYLITYAPVLESPKCRIDHPQTAAGTATAEAAPKAKAPKGYVKWEGSTEIAPDDSSRGYFLCADDAYEAFCMDNNGFAVYLPEGVVPEYLAFTVNGKLEKFTIQ